MGHLVRLVGALAVTVVAAGLAGAVARELALEPPAPPKVWANLRWAPARPLTTLGPGSTSGALAVAERQLLMAEIHAEGVYLSELDPETVSARWTIPVAAAFSGRQRSRVQLAAVRDRAWVSWLEQPSTADSAAPRLMVCSVDLGPREAQAAVDIVGTSAFGATSHNQQPYLAWLGGTDAGSISLASGPPESSFQVRWQPATGGRLSAVAVASLSANLGLAFLSQEQNRDTLWLAEYNGQRFYGLRKLRSAADLDAPTMCMLQNRILLMYTEYSRPGAGDLQLTVTNPVGSELVSVPYLADGHLNVQPSLAVRDRTAFVLYSARQGATDLGLFLGEIESVV